MAAVAAVAAPSAMAVCDDGAYWNVASQYHSPDEGHACAQYGPGTGETLLSTFETYSTIRGFSATNGGSWTQSVLLDYNVGYRFFAASDKVGCQNNHGTTIWVNCHHHNS